MEADTLVTDYIYDTWPLACVHCQGTDLLVSPTKDDVLCECCGKWQLEEDE